MFWLILLVLLFLVSLFSIMSPPALWLWYMALVATEFPWLSFGITCFALVMAWVNGKYTIPATVFGLVALVFFSLPVIQAKQISRRLDKELSTAFGGKDNPKAEPFTISRMFTGMGEKELPYETIEFDTANKLTLDYYYSLKQGNRPCVVIIHGGSWKNGDSRQLPELNTKLAKLGYNVAAINYRKVPQCKSPGPLEDLQTALNYLHTHADVLKVDTSKIVLLGRSAGAQIALLGAYTFRGMGIKGAISYYGPADMVWGYQNPAKVYNSCQVLEDYIGGTYAQLPDNYFNSSPIEFVTPHTVPTLMIQGKNDVLVAYGHSVRLTQKLKENGVPHYFLSLPWASHGCDANINGPSGQLATYSVERFLHSILE